MVPRRGSSAPMTDCPASYRMRKPVGSSKIVARSREQSSPGCVPRNVTFTLFCACAAVASASAAHAMHHFIGGLLRDWTRALALREAAYRNCKRTEMGLLLGGDVVAA